MADFHVAAILHAPRVDTLESAPDLSLQVLSPALNAKSVAAAQREHFVLLEHLVANRAVASVLAWEARVHIGPDFSQPEQKSIRVNNIKGESCARQDQSKPESQRREANRDTNCH